MRYPTITNTVLSLPEIHNRRVALQERNAQQPVQAKFNIEVHRAKPQIGGKSRACFWRQQVPSRAASCNPRLSRRPARASTQKAARKLSRLVNARRFDA
jgi:hypothetical protein